MIPWSHDYPMIEKTKKRSQQLSPPSIDPQRPWRPPQALTSFFKHLSISLRFSFLQFIPVVKEPVLSEPSVLLAGCILDEFPNWILFGHSHISLLMVWAVTVRRDLVTWSARDVPIDVFDGYIKICDRFYPQLFVGENLPELLSLKSHSFC